MKGIKGLKGITFFTSHSVIPLPVSTVSTREESSHKSFFSCFRSFVLS
jgi:hypothetical protein